MESAVFQSSVAPPLRGESKTTYVFESAMNAPASTLAGLFEAEEGPLLHFAWGLVGQRMVAEELVQEAFLRLHPLWSEVENPRAWLYRCVRNLALNHLRDHRRETGLEDVAEVTAGSDALPVEEMGRQEAVGLVRLFLAELPEEDRGLIQLKYHEDLKYHEIAGRTGLNAGNVGYKLHHLLKKLADALKSAGIEGSRG
ncbi:MAG: polymerase, sigma-24 subunit, subfamily [Rariglobus sp.]|jgi:RNA polymerase sigma-70 factor (ECF subfamily)|nr:polymerase, sigma-24 subunit, subfamily [Rariglobus sp.]